MAKVALLIGVSEYEPGLNSLPAAVKDVEAMRQVLQHPDMGGFSETDVVALKNPDRQQMEEAIENLFAGHQRDDLLLLFFSGHGIKDVETGRFYLTTRQTRKNLQGDLIRSTSVSAASIHDSMSRSRSRRQIVILDSCFSGAFADGLSAKDDGTVNIQEQLGGEGRAILTSSTSTQPSFEEKGQDLSVYTRYLVDGIQTGAADHDRDGIVSIGELHDYAKKQVQAIRPTMKPEIYPGREGSSIRLAKAPTREPHLLYRKTFKQLVSRDELAKIPHDILDALRKRHGVSLEKANEIEEEVLREHRKYKRNWEQYYQQLSAEVAQQYPLTPETQEHLRGFQQLLELTDKDIEQIEAHVLLQEGLSGQNHQPTSTNRFSPSIPQVSAQPLLFQPRPHPFNPQGLNKDSTPNFHHSSSSTRYRSNLVLLGLGSIVIGATTFLTCLAWYKGSDQQHAGQQTQRISTQAEVQAGSGYENRMETSPQNTDVLQVPQQSRSPLPSLEATRSYPREQQQESGLKEGKPIIAAPSPALTPTLPVELAFLEKPIEKLTLPECDRISNMVQEESDPNVLKHLMGKVGMSGGSIRKHCVSEYDIKIPVRLWQPNP